MLQGMLRRARVAVIALALTACAPTLAYAAPVDILEDVNTAMGSITLDNLYEDNSLISRYSDNPWEYVSVYDESGTVDGAIGGSLSTAAHTVSGTISVPKITITTAAFNAPMDVYLYGYTPYGYDEGGTYIWHSNTYSSTIDTRYPTRIKFPQQTSTIPALSETLSMSVPKVTTSSALTFDAQDTRVGTVGPQMMRLRTNGFTSTSSDSVYMCMVFGGPTAGRNLLYEGDVCRFEFVNRPMRVDDTWRKTNDSTLRVYYYVNGSYHEMVPDAGGSFTMPSVARYLIFVFRATALPISSSNKYVYVDRPKLYVYRDYDTQKQTQQLQQEIQDQTEELKNTDGASGIGGTLQNKGNEIVNSIPIVGDLATEGSEVGAILQSGDSQDYVQWPGLTYAGFTIPAYRVEFWQALPDLKEPVRWATTFIFVTQFLRAIYAAIWKNVFGVEDLDSRVSVGEAMDLITGETQGIYEYRGAIHNYTYRRR